MDLYGGDQAISVSFGSEEDLKKKQKVCITGWIKYYCHDLDEVFNGIYNHNFNVNTSHLHMFRVS